MAEILDQLKKNWEDLLRDDECDLTAFSHSVTAVKDPIGTDDKFTLKLLNTLRDAADNHLLLCMPTFLDNLLSEVMSLAQNGRLNNLHHLYDFVERNIYKRISEVDYDTLNCGSQNSSGSPPLKRSRTAVELRQKLEKVLLWCAELWLIKYLQGSSNAVVVEWMQDTFSDLFTQYIFDEDKGEAGARYKHVIDLDCVDLLENIFQQHALFRRSFNRVLSVVSQLHELTNYPMGKSMFLFLNQQSDQEYLIPNAPGETTESKRMKMYAINMVCGNENEDGMEEGLEELTEDLTEAEDNAGFEVINIEGGSTGMSAGQLVRELKTQLLYDKIQKECSLLFVTFHGHGFARHITMGSGRGETAIEIIKLLAILNIPELEKIVKVGMSRYGI